MSESTTLVEQGAEWRSEARVDRAARVVRNVALAGPVSKNGHRYSEQALRAGAALYEGKPVFLDHARDPRRPQERSTRDLVGSIVEPRYEGGRIRGDIQVLDTEAGQTFLSLVESEAPGVGMSHVVLAERGADGALVERIRDVISVDAVIGPATTTTFRESVDGAAAVENSGPDLLNDRASFRGADRLRLPTWSEEGVGFTVHPPPRPSPREKAGGGGSGACPEFVHGETAALRAERDALAARVAVLEGRQSEADRRASA